MKDVKNGGSESVEVEFLVRRCAIIPLRALL